MYNFQGKRSQGLSFFEDLSVGIGTSLDIYSNQQVVNKYKLRFWYQSEKRVENKAEQLGVGDKSNFSIVFHKFRYDKVLANTASSEPKTFKFQSGLSHSGETGSKHLILCLYL